MGQETDASKGPTILTHGEGCRAPPPAVDADARQVPDYSTDLVELMVCQRIDLITLLGALIGVGGLPAGAAQDYNGEGSFRAPIW